MHTAQTATSEQIIRALELFESDPAVFRLPGRELHARIKRYKAIGL
ncbi:hypothetical protein CCP4SC76_4130009 [Gammaproteobacteria bacterium]